MAQTPRALVDVSDATAQYLFARVEVSGEDLIVSASIDDYINEPFKLNLTYVAVDPYNEESNTGTITLIVLDEGERLSEALGRRSGR